MQQILAFLLLTLTACIPNAGKTTDALKSTSFTETEILKELDLAFNGIPSEHFPKGTRENIKYNFFIDLEHGYFVTAGNKIHLYADSTRWAIVFEKNGFANRGPEAEIELLYFGNCINYNINSFPERDYISNMASVTLITPAEYGRIAYKDSLSEGQYELIRPTAKEVNIRNKKVPVEHNINKYLKSGIKPRDDDNPKKLIGYDDLIRYIYETTPEVVAATEEEIGKHIPNDLPELMTLDKFHFESAYKKELLPSQQETYQLIAKILVTKNPSLWLPKLKPNNHWSNWVSGNL